MSNKMSNTYNETMGGMKEKIGKATHNEHMAGAGAAQKVDAQVKQQNQKAQTHAQGVGHNIQGENQMATGTLSNDNSLEGRGNVVDNSLQGRGNVMDSSLQGRGNAMDNPLQGRANAMDNPLQGSGNVMDNPLQGRGNANDALGDVQRNY